MREELEKNISDIRNGYELIGSVKLCSEGHPLKDMLLSLLD